MLAVLRLCFVPAVPDVPSPGGSQQGTWWGLRTELAPAALEAALLLPLTLGSTFRAESGVNHGPWGHGGVLPLSSFLEQSHSARGTQSPCSQRVGVAAASWGRAPSPRAGVPREAAGAAVPSQHRAATAAKAKPAEMLMSGTLTARQPLRCCVHRVLHPLLPAWGRPWDRGAIRPPVQARRAAAHPKSNFPV